MKSRERFENDVAYMEYLGRRVEALEKKVRELCSEQKPVAEESKSRRRSLSCREVTEDKQRVCEMAYIVYREMTVHCDLQSSASLSKTRNILFSKEPSRMSGEKIICYL